MKDASMTTATVPYTSQALTDALARVESGEITLAEAALALRESTSLSRAPRRAVVAFTVPDITEGQRDDLTALPGVYGSVVPTERRTLEPAEITALMQERERIDSVLAFAKKRKEESLRETVANHFDVAYEASEDFDPETPVDPKGHYIFAEEAVAEAPGTGKKFVMKASNPSPTIDSAMLEKAFENGDFSRADYLALTTVPPVARVFNQEKAQKAIKDNPALLGIIARAAKAGTPVNTLRIANA
jgi:hypothetical protein